MCDRGLVGTDQSHNLFGLGRSSDLDALRTWTLFGLGRSSDLDAGLVQTSGHAAYILSSKYTRKSSRRGC
mgnify:CR=1 FL=1